MRIVAVQLTALGVFLLSALVSHAQGALLDEDSILVAEHTGIEIRSVSHDMCPKEILMLTRSVLVGQLFKEGRIFRPRVIGELGVLLDKCGTRPDRHSLPLTIFLDKKPVTTLELSATKENGRYTFDTSNYTSSLTPNPKIEQPGFYDIAARQMAYDDFTSVFPELEIPKLKEADVREASATEADAALLSALIRPGKNTESKMSRKMFYRQDPHVEACDFDQQLMIRAAEFGNSFANFLIADCLFSKADERKIPFSFDVLIDLRSIGPDVLPMFFYAAKMQRHNRLLKGGVELASHIRAYGGKELPELTQSFVDSAPQDVGFSEYREFLKGELQ